MQLSGPLNETAKRDRAPPGPPNINTMKDYFESLFCYDIKTMQNKDFDEAMAAAKENKIHEWVLSFLKASGDNQALAVKLEKTDNIMSAQSIILSIKS